MQTLENSKRADRPDWNDTSDLIGGSRSKLRDPTGKAGQIVALMEQRLTIGYYKSGEMLSFATLAEEWF